MINKIIRYLTSIRRASSSKVSAKPLEWPVNPDGAQVSPPNEADLIKLDRSYEGMYGLHRSIHLGLAKELVDLRIGEQLSTLLEVAAGTGWNATKLINGGFDYWALDLSETATAVAMRRHPEAKFINASIDEAAVIRDGAFDVVFCASMLEHLKDPERALRHLVRIGSASRICHFLRGPSRRGPRPDCSISLYESRLPCVWHEVHKSTKRVGWLLLEPLYEADDRASLSRNWTDVDRILGCEQSSLHQRGNDPSRQEIEVFSAAHQPARHRG